MVAEGRLAAIGAMYDVATGECRFLIDDAIGLSFAEEELEKG